MTDNERKLLLLVAKYVNNNAKHDWTDEQIEIRTLINEIEYLMETAKHD